MYDAAHKGDLPPKNIARSEMLVLGYQHTLRPRTTGCDTYRTEPRADAEESPPQIEGLVAALSAEALSRLSRQVSPMQRSFAGSDIPLDGMIASLQQHLRGLLAQVIALEIDTYGDEASVSQQYLAGRFPALSPLLQQAVRDWVTATATFHVRLHRDATRLAAWLGIAALPCIESITCTGSDPHPGGHRVLRMLFRDGPCLYYKPRPISGEWLWQHLLQVIATKDTSLRLPAARVLRVSADAGYGWAESVPPAGTPTHSTTSAGGTGYWQAAGAMLCLAYHVGLSDLHLGNVNAAADGPAVTDAECLAAPAATDFASSTVARATVARATHLSGFRALEAMTGALLDTGLLPCEGTDGSPDVSGLFGCEAPVPGVGVPRWMKSPEGGYRLVCSPAVLMRHGGTTERVSPLSVLPQLLEGYRHGAEGLLRCRKALLGEGSLWRHVLQNEHGPRVVLRETFSYARLLSDSSAPESLGSRCGRRKELLARLEAMAPAMFSKAVIRTEVHSLLHLHLPRFVILPGTRTLAGGSGRPLVHRFVGQRPSERVLRRMEELSLESLGETHIPALLMVAFHPNGRLSCSQAHRP